MSFFYFAYGSNMLAARLAHRCPSASVVGPASAAGHRLTFEKASSDGSGKAMLAAEADSMLSVPGVLFEIALADRPGLDEAEGVGFGYQRADDFPVTTGRNGKIVEATTYLATRVDPRLKPYDWYLALVIAGAHQHGLDGEHLGALRRTEYVVDDDQQRKARAIALRALQSSGHPDYRRLLGS